ncbi:MAG TPA: hypothetical protein VKF80_06955 [Candidatus Eisenbacteria bacterium]|nr:hypothetical protein [Candidatus Eisenbacteria bacterium]
MKRSYGLMHRLAGTALALGAALILMAGARTASAGTDADLRGGYYFDSDAFALGGGLLTSLDHGGSWYFNPNLEAAFGDHQTTVTVNGDLHYDLPIASRMSWWVGAGPALVVRDPDVGSSNSNFGVNVLGGVGGRGGSVRPFAQFKAIVSDNSETALMGGVRF